MGIRLKPATRANGEIVLALPAGRHLERGGWFVAADTINKGERLIALRVWPPHEDRARVIVLDRAGALHDTVRTRTYEEAKTVLPYLTEDVGHALVDGRRLVSGGDADWEIAAEIHNLDGEEILLLRIWLQRSQAVAVWALDGDLVVRGHDVAGTYKRALSEITAQITA